MGNAVQSLVFRPPVPASYGTAHGVPRDFFRIPRGDLSKNEYIYGFFVDRKSSITILYSHGNAEDLGSIYRSICKKSLVWGVSIFAYEYTGYGPHPFGEPSEKNVYKDIDAAYAYMSERLGISSRNIVVFGRSLGSGPSCYLASRLPCRGLILQSAFASIFKVALRSHLSLPGDMFDNVSKIKKVTSKVLIIHGTRDALVPVSHGKQLHSVLELPSAPLWIEEAGHNNVETITPSVYYSGVKKFLLEVSGSTVSFHESHLQHSTTMQLPYHRATSLRSNASSNTSYVYTTLHYSKTMAPM